VQWVIVCSSPGNAIDKEGACLDEQERERAVVVVVVVVVTVVQEERWPIPRNTISRKQDLHSFL
jgi:hypothetical protein